MAPGFGGGVEVVRAGSNPQSTGQLVEDLSGVVCKINWLFGWLECYVRDRIPDQRLLFGGVELMAPGFVRCDR